MHPERVTEEDLSNKMTTTAVGPAYVPPPPSPSLSTGGLRQEAAFKYINIKAFHRAIRDEDWDQVERLSTSASSSSSASPSMIWWSQRNRNSRSIINSSIDPSGNKTIHCSCHLQQHQQQQLQQQQQQPRRVDGWTAMHVASSKCSTMSPRRWRWILHQARTTSSVPVSTSSSCPSVLLLSPFCNIKTESGDYSVVDIFFRTWFRPFPSQTKAIVRTRSKKLRTSIHRIISSMNNDGLHRRQEEDETKENNNKAIRNESTTANLLRQLQRHLLRSTSPLSSKDELEQSEDSIQQENIVLVFLIQLVDLMDAIILDDVDNSLSETPSYRTTHMKLRSMLKVLAELSYCPELVGRLFVTLIQKDCSGLQSSSATSLSNLQVLPLHRWCLASINRDYNGGAFSLVDGPFDPDEIVTNCTARNDDNENSKDDPGVLGVICETFPDSAGVRIRSLHYCEQHGHQQGRLPLHAALASGKSWYGHRLYHIAAAYPKAVELHDAATRLPTFCLPLVKSSMNCTNTSNCQRKETNASTGDPACDDDGKVTISLQELEETAKYRLDGGLLSHCWLHLNRTERCRAIDRARSYMECDELTTMFVLLRLNPSVLEQHVCGLSMKQSWETPKDEI